MAAFIISYDQLVGPDLILFAEFRTADTIALTDGMTTFLGILQGMAKPQDLMVVDEEPAVVEKSPFSLELVV